MWSVARWEIGTMFRESGATARRRIKSTRFEIVRNCRRQGRFVSLPVQLGGASSLPNFSNRRGISGNLGRLPLLLLLLHDQVYFFPLFLALSPFVFR